MSKKLRISLRKNGAPKESAAMLELNDVWNQLFKLSTNKLKTKAQRFFLAHNGTELTEKNCVELITNFGDGVVIAVSKGENYETHQTAKAKPATAAAAAVAADDKVPEGKAGSAAAATAAAAAAVVEDAKAVHMTKSTAPVRVLCHESWLDETAVSQLKATAAGFSDCKLAVGMPDLHPGNTYPIGTAFASSDNIYPHLIGGDIGCGMSLVQTQLRAEKASAKRIARWADKLRGLDEKWTGDINQWLTQPLSWPAQTDAANAANAVGAAAQKAMSQTVYAVPPIDSTPFTSAGVSMASFDAQVGTIGGGNHFAELQSIEKVVDAKLFADFGLSENFLYLLVHSGSRGLGDAVLDRHTKQFSTAGLKQSSNKCKQYLAMHDQCCMWAKRNRALIARRFMEYLTAVGDAGTAAEDDDLAVDAKSATTAAAAAAASQQPYRCVLDVWHNLVVSHEFDAKLVEQQRVNDETAKKAAKDAKDGKADAKAAAKSDAKSTASAAAATPIASASAASAASTGDAKGAAKGPNVWVHRKGATPSDQGLVVIPGSRGDFSYLVLPSTADYAQHYACFSLAHGAGRKWHRGKAKKTLQERFPNASKLAMTDLHSHVICEDKDLIYEEAPQAYKEVETIINDLVKHQLITVVAILRPLITYKVRRS